MIIKPYEYDKSQILFERVHTMIMFLKDFSNIWLQANVL
jgi:hypothetical protein